MDDKQHEFTIHEFDALREEINGDFQEMRKLEVYAVVATAIMYSFLISLERGGNGRAVLCSNTCMGASHPISDTDIYSCSGLPQSGQ